MDKLTWHDGMNYSTYNKIRRIKCKSKLCETMLNTGDDCYYFHNYREPTEWEISNIGKNKDEWIYKSSIYYCVKCGDLAIKEKESTLLDKSSNFTDRVYTDFDNENNI